MKIENYIEIKAIFLKYLNFKVVKDTNATPHIRPIIESKDDLAIKAEIEGVLDE